MAFDLHSYRPVLAYFSFGAHLDSSTPTYSGGLEMLSGDTAKTLADMRIPAVVVIQASNAGYFRQEIDGEGWQIAHPINWKPSLSRPRILETVQIKHEGRDLTVGAVLYECKGESGYVIPVLMLDTDYECNTAEDRRITGMLYSDSLRIAQENVLGQAGIKLIQEIGWEFGEKGIRTVHMNEGHAAFGVLELLNLYGGDMEKVMDLCAFTTHTPEPGGHEKWPYEQVRRIVGGFLPGNIGELSDVEGELGMTKLGAGLSRYVGGVSRQHGEMCRSLDAFRGIDIDYITNGVHPPTWLPEREPMAKLLDDHFRSWRHDPRVLEDAVRHISRDEILAARDDAKRRMIGRLNRDLDVALTPDAYTIVWARRFVSYKRPDLILRDLDELHHIAEKYGKIQIIFAGKVHPNDRDGLKLLHDTIGEMNKHQNGLVVCTFAPGYNPESAKRLIAGADGWLSTPRRPHEACGTSGMKALFAGTRNISSWDGWIPEGYEINPDAIAVFGPKEGRTELSPWQNWDAEDDSDAGSLYEILREEYDQFGNSDRRADNSLANLGLAPYFSSHRMVLEYMEKVWRIKLSEFYR